MKLPLDLTINFKKELNQLEEEQQMRYVTSIEQLAMAEGMQVGRQEGRSGGMIELFLNMLNMRFPNFDLQVYRDKIFSAAEDQLNRYSARLFTAKNPEEVFDDDNEKK
jgi:flagellar biosynthesis/type III secretory pathway protein FliH